MRLEGWIYLDELAIEGDGFCEVVRIGILLSEVKEIPLAG